MQFCICYTFARSPLPNAIRAALSAWFDSFFLGLSYDQMRWLLHLISFWDSSWNLWFFFYLFSFHRLVVLWPLCKSMDNNNQFPVHHYLQTLFFFFPFSALEVTGGAFDFFIALGMLPLKALFSVHRTKLSKIGFAPSAFYNSTMHANK